MIDFVRNIQREINGKIEKIERSGDSTIQKATEASQILTKAFNRLKDFIISYEFRNEAEEIKFFKEIKPRLSFRLIYYRKLFNIEMNRPVAGTDAQKEYLRNELDAINRYTNTRLDFVRYYRAGSTHLDGLYFLREQTDVEQYWEPFYYERDPQFSTICDYKVAKIMANDMLSVYLMAEIEALEYKAHPHAPCPFPDVRLTWQDSKTDLIELIYALDSKGSFGNVSLTQLANYLFNVFNISQDHSMSRTFCDMKIRNNPTPFLDSLKKVLLERMQQWKRRKKKPNNTF